MKKHDIERIDKLQRTVTSLSMRVDTLAVRLDQLQRPQRSESKNNQLGSIALADKQTIIRSDHYKAS